ncbi:hypothetical protein E2C01_053989 [Portunus trituberculatus]|uniref:Uncharacterized protein n=1 Tax=Portunus trituberculatus TaxID=210409 RepID=A0A5B7GRY6_PORTR|nr:hypothetical protein [Portunus trituberculatus]
MAEEPEVSSLLEVLAHVTGCVAVSVGGSCHHLGGTLDRVEGTISMPTSATTGPSKPHIAVFSTASMTLHWPTMLPIESKWGKHCSTSPFMRQSLNPITTFLFSMYSMRGLSQSGYWKQHSAAKAWHLDTYTSTLSLGICR